MGLGRKMRAYLTEYASRRTETLGWPLKDWSPYSVLNVSFHLNDIFPFFFFFEPQWRVYAGWFLVPSHPHFDFESDVHHPQQVRR